MHTLVSMDGAKFGEWSREVRENLGWNQVELSERIGFDQSHISKIERGRQPTADYVMAFAKATGQDRDLALSKAGIGDIPIDDRGEAMAELMAEFDRLSLDDQRRLIALARGLRDAAKTDRGGGRKR